MAITDAAVNAEARHAEAKAEAKAVMSVPPKPRATPPVKTAPKAREDEAEAIAQMVDVAKRQRLLTWPAALWPLRLWPQARRTSSARRVKKPKAAVVADAAANAQAKPRQIHK